MLGQISYQQDKQSPDSSPLSISIRLCFLFSPSDLPATYLFNSFKVSAILLFSESTVPAKCQTPSSRVIQLLPFFFPQLGLRSPAGEKLYTITSQCCNKSIFSNLSWTPTLSNNLFISWVGNCPQWNVQTMSTLFKYSTPSAFIFGYSLTEKQEHLGSKPQNLVFVNMVQL